MNEIVYLRTVSLPLVKNQIIYVHNNIADDFDFHLKEICFLTQLACEYRVNHLMYINTVQYHVWIGEKAIMLEVFYDKKNRLEYLMLHNGIDKAVEITDGKEQIKTLKKFYEMIATG
jgi:hypothetical protein